MQTLYTVRALAGVLLIILTTGCVNLAKRYKSNRPFRALTVWISNEEVPKRANVSLHSYPVAAATPTALLPTLTADGQAALIEAVASKLPVGTTPANLFAQLGLPASKPVPTEPVQFKYYSPELSRHLVFTIDRLNYAEKQEDSDNPTTVSFNAPADRLSFVEMHVVCNDSSLRFTDWNGFVSNYSQISLGTVTAGQTWGAKVTGATEASASIGGGSSSGTSASVTDGANVSPSATNGSTSGSTTSTGATAKLGANGELSFSNTYQTSHNLTSRILALSGTLKPNKLVVKEEGAQGIDLSGNVAFTVQMKSSASWAAPLAVTKVNEYFTAGVPIAVNGLVKRKVYIYYPNVPADISATLKYKFIYRKVYGGEQHLPEARHRVQYKYGQVGFAAPTDNEGAAWVRNGKPVVLIPRDAFVPKTYRLATAPAGGGAPAALTLNGAELRFESAEEAQAFHRYALALCATGGVVTAIDLAGVDVTEAMLMTVFPTPVTAP